MDMSDGKTSKETVHQFTPGNSKSLTPNSVTVTFTGKWQLPCMRWSPEAEYTRCHISLYVWILFCRTTITKGWFGCISQHQPSPIQPWLNAK